MSAVPSSHARPLTVAGIAGRNGHLETRQMVSPIGYFGYRIGTQKEEKLSIDAAYRGSKGSGNRPSAFWSSVVTAEPSYAQRDKTINAMPSIPRFVVGKMSS